VRLRVPHASAADTVVVRSTPDAEPRFVEATRDRVTATDEWWTAELRLVNPVTSYRFLLERRGAARWANGAGTHRHDVTDAADFRVTTHDGPPAWLPDAVGYEIFPDRFARSDDPREEPDWATPAGWDDPVETTPARAVRQWFGGDLRGITEHLDHLAGLGVNLVYLTPFFPGHSSHRYDAATFDHVDPALGGDDALVALTSAAHARGIRVIGDLTLNHTGSHHDWFLRARADAASTEAGFYMFRHHPDDYVAWYDVPSLPKLDHRSESLRHRLVDGPDSVVARWLREPYSLDGWRIDCANTTARHADVDVNAAVARTTRATMAAATRARGGDGAWLVAEHCYDATTDLDGAGWHGVMAYQWFTRPLAQWLGTAEPLRMMSSRPLPPLDGATAVATMRSLSAGIPWTAITGSMTMLDSHDTARFRTLVGDDADAHHAALTMLMAFPGVPTLFAGSEVGVGGAHMDAARVPFPWDEDRWDRTTLETVRRLVAVRRASPALCRGGLRWVQATPDSLTFLREHPDERVLVHVARPGAEAVAFDAPALGAGGPIDVVAGPPPSIADSRTIATVPGTGASIWRLPT
jgi:alpha-glucosidase